MLYRSPLALACACLFASVGVANAATISVVNPVGVTGHDGGNWPSSLGHLTDMLNATDVGFATSDHNPGIDTSADPNDPTQWVNSSTDWKTEWLANSRLDSTTSLNSKIGWAVIDFGSVATQLDSMYLWSNRNAGAGELTDEYNVYYSSGVGIDALPAMPNSKTNVGDYDFSSGDWTQLGSTNTLPTPSSPYTPDATLALGGISAQYIGIEILTAQDGVGTTSDRVGLAQVEFTQVIPEPASLVLMGIGTLMIAGRRRK